ncbi:putative nucleic acid-binding protein [Tissierella praeacuta]|uniref:PIN domain-containing protein n=1 Tax=Tissierella praeacuta TaxID=43131 RepID=UPI0010515B32|nr:PIN domain-containing protein [Tissierella praeacuta]TCU67486.1 putative nucleic acid-binding protein [Tissierella praeacuta]
MSFYYFDTNALVKLVLEEKGHEETIKIYNKEETMIIISNLSITEVHSTLNQKKSRREITETMYEEAISAFNNVIIKSPKIIVVEITSEHYKNATSMVSKHGTLRSLDALHLATALEFIELPITLVSADRKFSNVARIEGLEVTNFEGCKCPECGSEIVQRNSSSICPTCGRKDTKVIMRCTGEGCDYECTECSIEFCKKYIKQVI